MQRSLQILLAVLVLALSASFAAGCGDDEESPAGGSTGAETPAPEPDPPQQPTQQDLAAAGVDPITGVYQGLELDTRQGGPIPNIQIPALSQAARAAGCTLSLNLPDEGNEHLEAGDPVPEYGTEPATSGDHEPVPAADGAYREAPPEQNVVHSLEHGRVAVQYSPELPEQQQILLKGVFDSDPNGMLLFENPDLPGAVAVTAWRNLMVCEQAAEAGAVAVAILAFRDRFRGKGPERIPL